MTAMSVAQNGIEHLIAMKNIYQRNNWKLKSY